MTLLFLLTINFAALIVNLRSYDFSLFFHIVLLFTIGAFISHFFFTLGRRKP